MKTNTLKTLGVTAVLIIGLGGLTWWRLDTSVSKIVEQEPPLPLTIRTHEVTTGDIQSWLLAEGTARSVRREYLTFEYAGRVAYVLKGADGLELREGTRVEAGTVLARQDQRSAQADLESAHAEIAEAVTQVTVAESEQERVKSEQELAATTLERFTTLVAQNSASKQELDEAQNGANIAAATVSQAASRLASAKAKVTSARSRVKQAELALEKTELIAPMDGVVAYVNTKEGYYFTPSMVRTEEETAALQSVPLVLIDPTAFEVTVNVPSFSRGRLNPGQAAVVAVSSAAVSQLGSGVPPTEGDSFVRGEVFSVNPAVSPGGRAVQVKIRVTENATLLEDGLFVSVWVAADSRENVIRVPVDAILHEDNSAFAFVVEEGVARRVPVTLGLQEFSMQEVLGGLTEGQTVVTDGRFKMSDGVSVRVIDAVAERSEVIQ
ncbi:Macrolide export protein MacA [Planctomycetes bacterium Poly30]|uniref:Macrolide export protein MacA n=1 Tax=Saltatorellus ferox TaxID=2528018 RepID=A0A518EKV7_9BACT|nr:Macrolide export protein MacA [Planctomycetes bacterium Poly30]